MLFAFGTAMQSLIGELQLIQLCIYTIVPLVHFFIKNNSLSLFDINVAAIKRVKGASLRCIFKCKSCVKAA